MIPNALLFLLSGGAMASSKGADSATLPGIGNTPPKILVRIIRMRLSLTYFLIKAYTSSNT